MEENQPKTGKLALTYGLILGGISVVFGLMLYSMDMHYQRDWTIQVVGIVITIVALALAINQFKKANNGFLTMRQALKVGVGTALIAAVIGILYQYILANFIDPEFMNKAIESQMSEAIASGSITSEQADQQMEMGKKFFWIGYPIYLIFSVIIGFIISLILGLIMKKQKPAY